MFIRGCPLAGRAAFLKVASLDFYRKRPRRLRRGGRPHFFPKKWGERRGRGYSPGAPRNGGSRRRWAVRTGRKPTAHCRPPHWLALAVTGAPAEAQRSTRKGHAASVRRQSRQRLRSGFGGERRPSGGNELSGLPESERSVAWADDAAPRVARIAVTPQALRAAALYRLRPPGRHRCHAPEIPRRSPRVCVGLGEPVRLPGPLSLPCSVGRGLAPAACPPGIPWGRTCPACHP